MHDLVFAVLRFFSVFFLLVVVLTRCAVNIFVLAPGVCDLYVERRHRL